MLSEAVYFPPNSRSRPFLPQTSSRYSHHLSPPSRCIHCDRSNHQSSTCLARPTAFTDADIVAIRCVTCREEGHCACKPLSDTQLKTVFCCKCGQKGHFGAECVAKRGGGTFRRNVQDYLSFVWDRKEAEDEERPQTNKERRYWEKVANKALKKAKRLRKEHRSRSRQV